jgi:hypothetical protein
MSPLQNSWLRRGPRSAVCQILRTHHEGEDLVLWPLLLERAESEATEIVAVMGEQHQAIAAAHDEAVHRLGDWCRFGPRRRRIRNGAR